MTMALIIIATLAYTGILIGLDQGARYLNSNLVGVIVNILGAIVPLVFFLASGVGLKNLGAQSGKGMAWAIFAGMSVGLFTFAITKLFSSNQEVSFVSPLVYGGAIVLVTLVGRFVLSEKVSLYEGIGVAAIALGIVCIVAANFSKGATI
jgi:drug/metabolite transporter (DMT)-like permease